MSTQSVQLDLAVNLLLEYGLLEPAKELMSGHNITLSKPGKTLYSAVVTITFDISHDDEFPRFIKRSKEDSKEDFLKCIKFIISENDKISGHKIDEKYGLKCMDHFDFAENMDIIELLIEKGILNFNNIEFCYKIFKNCSSKGVDFLVKGNYINQEIFEKCVTYREYDSGHEKNVFLPGVGSYKIKFIEKCINMYAKMNPGSSINLNDMLCSCIRYQPDTKFVRIVDILKKTNIKCRINPVTISHLETYIYKDIENRVDVNDHHNIKYIYGVHGIDMEEFLNVCVQNDETLRISNNNLYELFAKYNFNVKKY
jgi:hypothetical protein